MDDESRELRERIARMSDAELWRMVGKDRLQYRDEAVAIARQELDARRGQETESTDDEVNGTNGEEAVSVDSLPCGICGGMMRRGALFADREMTVYFDDTDEERFVEAMVCSACGTMRLVVDLDTDVQE
jgi:hypothetical protein